MSPASQVRAESEPVKFPLATPVQLHVLIRPL